MRKDYYTKRQIATAWVKKKLGIVSPSALLASDGKYKYAYDYIMKKESDNLCDNCKFSDTCTLSLKGLTGCRTTKCFRYEWAKKEEAENDK